MEGVTIYGHHPEYHVTFINRVHPYVTVNMSVKFDEEARNAYPSGHLIPSRFGGGDLHMLYLLRQIFSTLNRFDDRTELDLHQIKRGFLGVFAMGEACQKGALTLSGNLVPSLLFWSCLCSYCWDQIPCPYSTFHLEYPSVLSRLCLSCSLKILFEV